jgi:hypothetical protein
MSRRHEMIEMLVDNDIDSIMADASQNDLSVLAEILCTGFKGYENFTDDELVQEMNERDLWNAWFKEAV